MVPTDTVPTDTVPTDTAASAPRTAAALLSQYLMSCPRCGNAGIAHLDESRTGLPVLVRFVCSDGCQVEERHILPRVPRRGRSVT